MAADPFVCRRPANAELFGNMSRRPPSLDPADEELATEDGQTRLRMCHESLPLGLVLNTPNRAAGLSVVNNVRGDHN
jgi:hypothetical protein